MNLREQQLMIQALSMLESACAGAGAVTDEVRALMDKIASMPIDVPLNDLPEHLWRDLADNRWNIWEGDPWEHLVGESEDDSVMGSWIGYALVQEIDSWLTAQGINYALFTE